MNDHGISEQRKRILSSGLKEGLGVEDIAVKHNIPISVLREQVSLWRKRNLLRHILDRSVTGNRRALEIMGAQQKQRRESK